MEEAEAERQSILGMIDYWFLDVKEHACGCRTPFAEGNMTRNDQGRLCESHDVMVKNEVQQRLNLRFRWESDIFSR